MTAITFPNSPSSGDTHTAGNGIVYTYDGEKWTSIGTNSAGTWTRSGTEVSLTNAGDDLNVDSGTLFVDASTDRVGVGTSLPQRPLHVDGTEGAARFTSTNSGNNGFEVGIGTSSQAFLWQSENAYMQFATNNSEAVRIDSSGRLLVGTTTTGGASTYYDDLVISNTDSGTGCGITLLANATNGFNSIDFGDTDSASRGRITYSHADDSLRIDTAGTQRIHVDSSGNVGIGRTPTALFDIEVDGVALHIGYGSNYDNYFTSGSSGITVFRAGSTERMRILSGGGLTFNGDTAQANALDDYEEGTWNPTITDNSTDTASGQNGRYTRIGDVVTVVAEAGFSNLATTYGGSTLHIKLPFAAKIQGGSPDPLIGFFGVTATQPFMDDASMVLSIVNTQSSIPLYRIASKVLTGSTPYQAVSGTQIGNNAVQFHLCFSYHAQ